MPIFIGVTEDRGGQKSGQGKLADLDALIMHLDRFRKTDGLSR
jgi:hypothetical protein